MMHTIRIQVELSLKESANLIPSNIRIWSYADQIMAPTQQIFTLT
jgi:hypothetical protein